MPTPQEWMKEQGATSIECYTATQVHAAMSLYHAHASAEEAEKVRRLVEWANAAIETLRTHKRYIVADAGRSTLDALKEGK